MNDCRDTAVRDVFVKAMPDPGFNNLKLFYCQSDSIIKLIPRTPGGNFFGNNVSGTQFIPRLLWEDTIRYVVTVNGCTDSSFQSTNVFPAPSVQLGGDTTLCKYAVLDLSVTSWNAQFLWDNLSTRTERVIDRAGTYWVLSLIHI